MTDASDNARKRCSECGHPNKLSAKNCTNCGHALPTVTADAAQRRKICPECGAVCNLEARACTNCGHRFSTDFSAPDAHAESADDVSMATMLTEAPITQTAPEPITLPMQYDAPPALPDAPDPVIAAPPPAAAIPAPPIDDVPDGEPAPDLSDLDLDTLRRASPEHKDAPGRVILSRFKKDRS